MRWESPEVISSIPTESETLQQALKELAHVLDKLAGYVDRVVNGEIKGDPQIGMALASVLDSVRIFKPEEHRVIVESKVQDMLMVTYLTTLVKSQLSVAEKLLVIL